MGRTSGRVRASNSQVCTRARVIPRDCICSSALVHAPASTTPAANRASLPSSTTSTWLPSSCNQVRTNKGAFAPCARPAACPCARPSPCLGAWLARARASWSASSEHGNRVSYSSTSSEVTSSEVAKVASRSE